MTLYKWSQTASADATADNTINWAEGQAPSSVNNSARAMMAATAKYRDDIAGAIVTTGTNTSYTVSSYQGFDTLAHLNGQMIAFTPHATNGISGSPGIGLNVDSLGTKPLRLSPGVECQPGTIIQGTPYVAVYNNSDGVFYLQGFYGNPYNVPLGAGLDYSLPLRRIARSCFPSGRRSHERLTPHYLQGWVRLWSRRRLHHVQFAGQARPCFGGGGSNWNDPHIGFDDA